MHNFADFFNIIILLGAIQGFIISSLLFYSKDDRMPKRLLGLFIFFIALACLNTYLFNQNWYTSSQLFGLLSAVIPMVIIMPAGPLIFFYTKASLDPGFKFKKNVTIQQRS